MNDGLFDTKVQVLKSKVIKEVATLAFNDELLEKVLEVPEKIIPDNKATMRCCVYKERAVLSKRIKLAIGGQPNKKVIQVIKIACEDCPTGGYEVTSSCRSCLAHRCAEACRRNAISFGANQKAVIDKSKCIECGACAAVCPYHAIIDFKRPCESSCRLGAIGTGADNEAEIDYDKCVSCGACSYACPFGAITDRSYVLDAVEILKNKGSRFVYALLAPAIAGQFGNLTIDQIASSLKKLGFSDVLEVASGADAVAALETKELEEKGFLISSCCPSFVSYVEKFFPELKENISKTPSPAMYLASLIKMQSPEAQIIFIGPCTSKKYEYRREEYKNIIDCVLTFEELYALFESRGIEIDDVRSFAEQSNTSSAYGRGFAVSGGLSAAINEVIKENNFEIDFNPVICSGLDECRAALLRAQKGVLKENFIEGMACKGGCAFGAGCLTHSEKNAVRVKKYAENGLAAINDSISVLKEKLNK